MQRRTFLKGLSLGAGASLLSPVLRDLYAQEGGAVGQRLIIVQIGNGVHPSLMWDDGAADLILAEYERRGESRRGRLFSEGHYINDTPLIGPLVGSINASLPEENDLLDTEPIAPLMAYRNEIALIHGLTNKTSGGGHYTNFGALSCAPGPNSPSGITIDTLLAQTLSRDKPFDVLRMSLNDEFSRGIKTSLQDSAYGPTRPAPVYISPDAAFTHLFGSVLSSEERAAFGKRGRLFNIIREDVGRAAAAMSGSAKIRMEHYLHSVETLEERHRRLTSMEAQLTQCVENGGDHFLSPHPGERLRAFFELGATALTCGLTNVLLYSYGGGKSTGVRWTDFEIENEGNFPSGHGIGHGAAYGGRGAGYWNGRMMRLHAEQIAGLIERLRAVPEGDGSMWDNTTILFQTSNHESHHSRSREWPAMLIGSAGGRLNTGGRAIIYPRQSSSGHKLVRNLYNTLGHAFGIELNDFGSDIGRGFEGPLTELLA